MTYPGGNNEPVRFLARFSPSRACVAGVRLFYPLAITLALLFAAAVITAAPKWQGDPPTHRVTLYPPTGTIVPHWKVRRPWLLANGAVCWRGETGPDISGRLPTPILRGWVCITGTVIVEPL